MREGIRNLYILARRLAGRHRQFAIKMIQYFLKVWINGSFPPSTWCMYMHDGESTNNHSEGYNHRLNTKKRLGKHPNVYKWTDVIIEELHTSYDNTVMAKAGNPNSKRKNRKVEKKKERREESMKQLSQGNVDILSYQQAMGGSVMTHESTQEVDEPMEFDENPLEISSKAREDEEIIIPELNEIDAPILPQAQSQVITPAPAPAERPRVYRHIAVTPQQKRRSEVSCSVAGNDLRRKRRRQDCSVPAMNQEPDIQQFPDTEFTKREFLDFLGLSNGSLLSLDQAQCLLEKRLRDLNFTLSPSQKVTPADGNCYFHAILDQLQYSPELSDFAETHIELRTRIVLNGYDLFLKSKKFTWPDDPKLGTMREWKQKMLRDGEWADMIALNLTASVLGIDIVVIPCFREYPPGPGLDCHQSARETKIRPRLSFLLLGDRFRLCSLPKHSS